MQKCIPIARMEIAYHLKKPSTWIYFVSTIGLTFLILTEIIDYSRTIGGVILNAPITIAEITGYSNLFGLLLIVTVVAHGGMREFQANMTPLIFTSSVTKSEFIVGKLVGLYITSAILVIAVLPCALLIADYTLELEDDLYGPFKITAFTDAIVYFTLPNVWVATCLAYAGTLYFRNLLGAYIGVLIYFVCSLIGSAWVGEGDVAGLMDPTGRLVLDAFRLSLSQTRLNTETVAFSIFLFFNRITWILVGISIMYLVGLKFSFTNLSQRRWFHRKPSLKNESPQLNIKTQKVNIQADRIFNIQTRLYQVRFLTLQYWKKSVFSKTGMFLLALSLLFFFLIPEFTEAPYEIPSIPTTQGLISLLKHPLMRSLIGVVLILYCGQLIWKERDVKFDELIDATPIQNTISVWSRFLAMALVIFSLMVLLIGLCLLHQMFSGFNTSDLSAYGVFFMTEGLQYWIVSAAVFVIHVLVNQKILGNFLGLLFYLYTLRPDLLRLESKLLIYGSHPDIPNSLFYSHTPFLRAWCVYALYWGGWALIFISISILLWNQGSDANFKNRIVYSLRNLKTVRMLVLPVGLSLITGAIIFYHTNVRNDHPSSEELKETNVRYETAYRTYRTLPQPLIIGTYLDIEFYPNEGKTSIAATYRLKNITEKGMKSIHVTTMPGAVIQNVTFNAEGHWLLKDQQLGYLIFELKTPMEPGKTVEMDFEILFELHAFVDSNINKTVMENGAYIENLEWFPIIGYDVKRELSDTYSRTKFKLPKRSMSEAIDSTKIHERKGQETIHFEAKIGTSTGQTAVAPGTLQGQWIDNNRQYFYYKTSQPILNHYKIYSATYSVRQFSWNNIPIKIYHHPENIHNLKNMETSAKATLSYASKNFGAYPFAELKFVEYPDTGTGAFAFPALIEYTTNFVLNQSNNEQLDLVFAATAHEVAHQWWGHKLLPAPVEGSGFLIESLAWYTSFGAIEATYGSDHVSSLLSAMKREYLNPRSKAGTSLLHTNSWFQAFRKGPLAMYALKAYVGETKINNALNTFIQKFESGAPPYATSNDLYKELIMVTPDSLHNLLKDLLEENTYWTLATTQAQSNKVSENQWRVTLEVFTKKIVADETGVETEQPVADLIEIGVYSHHSTSPPIYLKTHSLLSGFNTITIDVDQEPTFAGIDPRNLLIDTEMTDNIIHVSFKQGPINNPLNIKQ